jgi:hypothetical protein
LPSGHEDHTLAVRGLPPRLFDVDERHSCDIDTDLARGGLLTGWQSGRDLSERGWAADPSA